MAAIQKGVTDLGKATRDEPAKEQADISSEP